MKGGEEEVNKGYQRIPKNFIEKKVSGVKAYNK
jgi:hypothetical protein